MHTWRWQTWNDLPYLTCSLLESWQHGFFTQQFSPRSPAELTQILEPSAEYYRVQQVHGNTVLVPSEFPALSEASFPDADALVTERSQQAVWVCSADCTPVLIADVQTGNAAAIHAGWRGTAQKIVPRAIARLCAQGSQLQDLRIALGPAIAGEVYQVSVSVAIEVGATVAAIDPDQAAASSVELLLQIPNSPILPDTTPGRLRLDVRRINALQLEQLGISSEQVTIAPCCTYQDATNFFSYRREKLKRAQWSGIVSGSRN